MDDSGWFLIRSWVLVTLMIVAASLVAAIVLLT